MGRDSRILFRQILTSSVELFGIRQFARGKAHRVSKARPHTSAQPSHSQYRSIQTPLSIFPRPHSAAQRRGQRGGARGGETAFRNYECFPSSQISTASKAKPFSSKKIKSTKKGDHQPKRSNSLQKKKNSIFIIYSLPFPASPQPSEPHSSHPAEEQYSE